MKGWGGEELLKSYDAERRPVSLNNLKMVEKGTYEVVLPMMGAAAMIGADLLSADTDAGTSARTILQEQIDKGHWLHNQYGTSMGFRYNPPIIIRDQEVPEPGYKITKYVPSTWPGARAPYVFLAESEISIFDLFGPEFNIVDFTPGAQFGEQILSTAKILGIPMTKIHLPNEKHVRDIWERDVVLVRPDGHVAWRLPLSSPRLSTDQIADVLEQVSGRKVDPRWS